MIVGKLKLYINYFNFIRFYSIWGIRFGAKKLIAIPLYLPFIMNSYTSSTLASHFSYGCLYIQISGTNQEVENHPIYKQLCKYRDFSLPMFRDEFRDVLQTLIIASKKGTYVGAIRAGIYPSTTMERPYQWGFFESRLRSCWVDMLWIKKPYRRQGIGSQLLKKSEIFFEENQHLIPKESKKNIYVAAPHKVCDFFVKNGYTIIATNDHVEDYDHVSVYQTETARFLAKPLNEKLDREEDDLYGHKEYELDLYQECHLSGAEKLPDEVYLKYVKYNTWITPYQILMCLDYSFDKLEIIRVKLQKAIEKAGGIKADFWDFEEDWMSPEKSTWIRKHFPRLRDARF